MNVRDELQRVQRLAPRVEPDLERLRRRRDRHARAGRVGTVALALVIGFGAVGAGWFAFQGEGGDSTARIADGAGVNPPAADLTLGGGEYYYVRIASSATAPTIDGAAQQTSARYETWWATDDSGRLHNIAGHWYDEGVYPAGGFVSDSGDVTDLSTDPVQLEAQLRVRVEPDGSSPEPYADWGGPIEWGLIRSIRELLLTPDVTPMQKAALVQVAANLDGVTVDDRALDPQGRAAILLSTHTEDKRTEWWFDPSSDQLLASRETYDADGSTITDVIEAAGIARSVETDHLVRAFIPSAD